VAGTWAENFSFPGASLVVTVDAFGNGSGTYAIEAGRSGVVQVHGTVGHATIMLTIQYDSGLVRTFTGSLSDANHLTDVLPTVVSSAGFSLPLPVGVSDSVRPEGKESQGPSERGDLQSLHLVQPSGR
jgi:hypothetical protein